MAYEAVLPGRNGPFTRNSSPALPAANWCVGRPQRTEQIHSHSTLADGTQQIRALATSWDATYCRPTQQVIEPDIAQWSVQIDLDYDAFGNVDMRQSVVRRSRRAGLADHLECGRAFSAEY